MDELAIGKGRVVVRGGSLFAPTLLDTGEASVIELYDSYDNTLMALMVRVFNKSMWGLVTKDDPDWEATLVKYGYLNVTKPIEHIIRNGL